MLLQYRLIIVLSFSLFFVAWDAMADSVVPDDYASIQAAVNAAQTGDVIQIRAGTYTETVTVNKAVTLRGDSADSVIVDGLHQNIPLTISGDGGVKVQQITFTNGYHYGIKISENAHSNVIEDCIVDTVGGTDTSSLSIYSSDPSFGIWMKESDNNEIIRTTVANVRGHLYSGYSASATGIYAENTENTLVQDCIIEELSGGSVRGIYLFNNYDNTFPSHGHRVEGGRISALSAEYTLHTIGAYGISCGQTHDLVISEVTFSDITCIDYSGWNPGGKYNVEGIRIDSAKRVRVIGCSFINLKKNGSSSNPQCIKIMGSHTSDTVIGGAEADANAFAVNQGYNVFQRCGCRCGCHLQLLADRESEGKNLRSVVQ